MSADLGICRCPGANPPWMPRDDYSGASEKQTKYDVCFDSRKTIPSVFSETKAFLQNMEESPLGPREVQESTARPGPLLTASLQASFGGESFLSLFHLKKILVF